jgi:tetratricopeptide (TPR) repeat protein
MDVFLSYARTVSRPFAEAVYRELGGEEAGIAFLDTDEIEHGDHFPQRLIDALLAARVVVIFADPAYFRRWYCVLEFRAARAPFACLAERAGATQEARSKALESVLVVLPPEGAPPLDMWNLPPGLPQTNWPDARDPAAVAAQVRRLLASGLPTLADRIAETVGVEKFRREWLEVARLPAPGRIPSETPFAPARGLPRPLHERFVGRADDLWRINDTLRTRRVESESEAYLTVALTGGAGVGKSRLALEYLYRFGPRYYPGGLFWIDAEHPIEQQYHQILRALNRSVPDLKTVQREYGGVRNLLVEQLRGLPAQEPALVVVDNIPEPPASEPPPPLDDWFPAVGEVSVLVTSRSRGVLDEVGGVVMLQLDVLEKEPAQALLTRDIDFHVIDATALGDIVEWVGRLPLALKLLNRALFHKAFSVDELLTLARSTPTTAVLDQAMHALRTIVPRGSLRGISELLTFSYQRLPRPARAAARLIAWLAPEAIPEALLDALNGDRFSPSVRSLLVAHSWVTEVPGTAVPMFGSMHRVFGDFLQSKSEDCAGELSRLTDALFSLMSPERIGAPAEPVLMDACFPLAVAVFNHSAVQQPRSEFAEQTASLAWIVLGPYLDLGAPAAEVAELVRRTLSELSPEMKPEQLTVDLSKPAVRGLCGILANALARDGDLDSAIMLQRPLLDWVQRRGEEGSCEVLVQSDNLADMLRARGGAADLEEAREILERTVPEWRRRDRAARDTLAAVNNLALVLQAQGNAARAAALFEDVLEGLNHLENVEMETIKTKRNLAGTLWEKNPHRAFALVEEALNAADEIRLQDHHSLKLGLLEQLAGRAHKCGDYEQAKRLLRRAVPAFAATRGDRDEKTTVCAWALFDAELRTGDTATAQDTCQRYLVWLLTSAEEELTREQRRVRADVRKRNLGR